VELPGLLSRALLRTGGEGSSREGRAATEGGAEQQLPHALSSPLLHASPLRDQCTDSIGSAHRQMEAGPSPEPDFFPGVDKSLLRDLQVGECEVYGQIWLLGG